jgi:uncharacterized protein (DUF885 family)
LKEALGELKWDPVRTGKTASELYLIRLLESSIDTDQGPAKLTSSKAVSKLMQRMAEVEHVRRRDVEAALGMSVEAFVADRQLRYEQLKVADDADTGLVDHCHALRRKMRQANKQKAQVQAADALLSEAARASKVVVRAARQRALHEARHQQSQLQLVNGARRWTEVEEKMGG